MKEKLRGILRGLGGVADNHINLIVDHSNIQFFPKATVLLREGEIPGHCYMVVEGCVREYFLRDGEEQTVSFFLEGDPVNSYPGMGSGEASKSYAICAEDCYLTVGDEDLISSMCNLVPELRMVMMKEVERGAGIMQEQMNTFLNSTPPERYEYLMATRPHLFHRVPQHQIASYLGMTPESLSRIKKRVLRG